MEKQIDAAIWTADAPIVLVSNTRKTGEEIFPYLDTHPDIVSYSVVSLEKNTNLIPALKESVSALYTNLAVENLASTDPEDWSLALRQVTRRREGGTRLLVVESFDEILQAPTADRNLFAAMICHIACESGLSVFLIANQSRTAGLGELPGFEHLGQIPGSFVVEVPGSWSPPKLSDSKPAPKEVSTRCVKSNVLLSSAVVVAAAMVMVSMWVTGQLGVNLALSSPPEMLRAGKVTTVNVAASGDLNPDRESSEFYSSDPIPVALGQEVEVSPKPVDSKLKSLLTMDEFPFESIAGMEKEIKAPAPELAEVEKEMPKEKAPLKKLEIAQAPDVIHLPGDANPATVVSRAKKQNKNRPRGDKTDEKRSPRKKGQSENPSEISPKQ